VRQRYFLPFKVRHYRNVRQLVLKLTTGSVLSQKALQQPGMREAGRENRSQSRGILVSSREDP
jgi:hypothetical protein